MQLHNHYFSLPESYRVSQEATGIVLAPPYSNLSAKSSLSSCLDASRWQHFIFGNRCIFVDVGWFEEAWGFVRAIAATSYRYACLCPQFDEISMVTLCLPFHLAQTINNSTVSLQAPKVISQYMHTNMHLLYHTCMDTSQHLLATCLR